MNELITSFSSSRHNFISSLLFIPPHDFSPLSHFTHSLLFLIFTFVFLFIFYFILIFTLNPSFVPYRSPHMLSSPSVLPLSLLSRSSMTVWTPMCPETGCCGILYLVVSMHFPSTQLTLPSSLFIMPYWVSVDLIKLEE